MVGNRGDIVEDEGFCVYLGGAAGTLERVSIKVDSPVLVSWYIAGTKMSSAMCSCCMISLDCSALCDIAMSHHISQDIPAYTTPMPLLVSSPLMSIQSTEGPSALPKAMPPFACKEDSQLFAGSSGS